MKKIINPVLCDLGGRNRVRGFAKINLEKDGRLSISGVIGPVKGGDSKGSCGQCIEEIRTGTPAEGWTYEMLHKFCDIWEEWHLNYMRPYCSHQKELGWDKLAHKQVALYNYTLTGEACIKQKAATDAAINALKRGEIFTPTLEQVKYANLPYRIKTAETISGEDAANYEHTSTDIQMLGLLRQDEHPDGILGKPCPVCGYQYGRSWYKEDVPQEVVDWLFRLPETTVRPAWI